MGRLRRVCWIGGLMVLAVSISLSAQSDAGRNAFLDWSRRAARPLATVRADAPHTDLRWLAPTLRSIDVVALGEADHGVAEPLEFRNRLFKYLVEEQGFTAIAIESGITESRIVHDYVMGGPGELAEVLAQGLSWTFDNLPQNAELIRWMRDYNADPAHIRKISFYGFDVPGSPGNLTVKRGMRTAIDDALTFLDRVDAAAATDLHTRLDRWLPHIRPAVGPAPSGRPATAPRYTDLTAAERDSMTAAIADLVTFFEHKEARYTAASSAADYAWAYRGALGARTIDAWLRHAARDGRTASRNSLEVRDRLQGDNVAWIVNRERPNGKVLIYAAWVHVATTPLVVPWDPASKVPDVALGGTYHRQHFANRLLTIGHVFRRGEWYCGADVVRRDDVVAGSLSQGLGSLKRPLFLLDLRPAPASVRTWLDRQHVVSDAYPWGRYELNVARGFDMLLYTDTVTGACAR